MTVTSTFSRFFLLPVALLAAACGDDESAAIVTTDDAGAQTSAAATSGDDSTESTIDVDLDASVSSCLEILHSCGTPDPVAQLCTELALGKNEDECTSVINTCLPSCQSGKPPSDEPSADQCRDMGHKCHDYDEGSGLGYLCHKVGHEGDLELCPVIYAACATLCHIEPGDGGANHHNEGDASHHDADAATHAPHDGGHEELDAAPTNGVDTSNSVPLADAASDAAL